MKKSPRPPRKSIHPPPRARSKSASRATTTTERRDRVSPLQRRVERLLTRAGVAVTPAMRAWLESLLSARQADASGRRHGTRSLLRGWLRDAEALVEAVLAGKVGGYGPLRFRYAVELAFALVQAHEGLGKMLATKTVVGAQARQELSHVDVLRAAARATLDNLHGADADAHRRVRLAVGTSASKEARIESLDELARQLEAVIREVPAEVAEDARAPKLLAALHEANETSVEATRAHDDERQTVSTTYDALHVLKGRLVLEHAALRRSARRARSGDTSVPALTRPARPGAGKKKTGAVKSPAKPVAPVTPEP